MLGEETSGTLFFLISLLSVLSVISIVLSVIVFFCFRTSKKDKAVPEEKKEIESNDQPIRPQGTWVTPEDQTELQQPYQSNLTENERDVKENIEWLKLLKERLKESVGRFSEDLDEKNWRELEERVAYLRRFLSALEEIKSAMSQDDRTSFAVYVDREVKKPLKQIRDLLTLREIQNASDDPVLLLKGALIGEEIFNASSIASLLRRTRPAQMIRYFLPEIDTRVTQNGQEGAERVFELMMDLGGDEVEIIGARAGDAFDTRRYQIISQDTSGTQPRDRIVRCLAHGLKNAQTDEIELKAKVVISG